MDRFEGTQTAPTIALHRGLYLYILIGFYSAILMDSHEVPHTTLIIALHEGLYFANILDRH
jgi:hypothetical protein